jgi:hypothetical protein
MTTNETERRRSVEDMVYMLHVPSDLVDYLSASHS